MALTRSMEVSTRGPGPRCSRTDGSLSRHGHPEADLASVLGPVFCGDRSADRGWAFQSSTPPTEASFHVKHHTFSQLILLVFDIRHSGLKHTSTAPARKAGAVVVKGAGWAGGADPAAGLPVLPAAGRGRGRQRPPRTAGAPRRAISAAASR